MSTNVQRFPAQFPISADPHRKIALASVAVIDRPHYGQVPKVGLSEICLSYRSQSGERLLALDHINLQVRAGEFVCIVGPSGCGKSTLLHLIAGLHQPDIGQKFWWMANRFKVRARIAFSSSRTTGCFPGSLSGKTSNSA